MVWWSAVQARTKLLEVYMDGGKSLTKLVSWLFGQGYDWHWLWLINNFWALLLLPRRSVVSAQHEFHALLAKRYTVIQFDSIVTGLLPSESIDVCKPIESKALIRCIVFRCATATSRHATASLKCIPTSLQEADPISQCQCLKFCRQWLSPVKSLCCSTPSTSCVLDKWNA